LLSFMTMMVMTTTIALALIVYGCVFGVLCLHCDGCDGWVHQGIATRIHLCSICGKVFHGK
jgi:hypothetical protein